MSISRESLQSVVSQIRDMLALESDEAAIERLKLLESEIDYALEKKGKDKMSPDQIERLLTKAKHEFKIMPVEDEDLRQTEVREPKRRGPRPPGLDFGSFKF